MSNLEEILKNSKLKTISLDNLKKYLQYTSQKELEILINKLINQNIIKPIKNSEKTFEIPQLYTKYKIIQAVNENNYTKEIKTLNTKLNIDYYLKNQKNYIKDKKIINIFSNYFYKKDNEEMSINERSYQLFNNEKFLLSKECSQIMNHLKISIEMLNVYKTPEPFFYYINDKSSSNNILIIENKDTWYTFRKNLMLGNLICNMDIKFLIYGEGKKIISSFKYFYLDEFNKFNNSENIYYFGDIDIDGINICLSMIKKYNIKPFYSGYKFLLEQKSRDKLDKNKGINLKMEDINKYFLDLNSVEKEKLIEICNLNKIIPQEALNNGELKRWKI